MSISWNLNKFAKNALLNAQKRIDSVLDIKEDGEGKETADEEEQPVSEIDSTNFSALSDTTEVESNTGNESVKFDGIDEVCLNASFLQLPSCLVFYNCA
jgi:hypothetical protein